MQLGAQAVRAVALGVVVTALVQALLGGIGLAICGVPFTGVLIAVMLILGIAQLGPGFVLIPSIVWLYWRGESTWGTVLLVWSLVVLSLDNILRPMLIKRGADLSLLLIFTGVIGGLVAFGIIGLFIGPVFLAVGYTLLGLGQGGYSGRSQSIGPGGSVVTDAAVCGCARWTAATSS